MTKQIEDEIALLKEEEVQLWKQIHSWNRSLTSLGSSKKGKSDEAKAVLTQQMDEIRQQKVQYVARIKLIENLLSSLTKKLEEAKVIENLDLAQAKRDTAAQRQTNGVGRRPNRGRDISWPLL